ncbi:MAG TPA: CHAT domain-containing tetratricopeptide repeat protein [Thermoanaerobaculia bacterium]|jgi:CHAT domain-containing protein/Tfp pilus assembly protein PilF
MSRHLLAFSAVALVAAALAAAEDPARLLPGRSIEQALEAGEGHAYRAGLAAGRPWLVVVEQRGIDVAVTASAPDGRRLAAVDNPFDRQGEERLLLEPEEAGDYRIEITAREPGAPPGRYALRVEALPPVHAWLEAERATARAGELYFEGSTEARRQAIAEHERALPYWRSLGDRRLEARALYAMGVLARLIDETRQARDLARQALPLWQALEEPLWEAATLNELGLDHQLLGDTVEARQLFDRALAVSRRIGDLFGEAVALANGCLMDLMEGELRAGAACYEQAIPRLRALRAANLENAARHSAGRAYDVLGEPERALAHYREGLALMRSAGDRKGEARTLNNLAALSRITGEVREALVHYGRALEIFEELEDRRWQARVLGNLGQVYLDLGETQRALAALRQALSLWREVADPRGEAAALATLGEAYSRLGKDADALAFHRDALALRRAIGDRQGEGIALALLARAQTATGAHVAALASVGQAIELLREVGDRFYEAAALRDQGELYTRSGEPGKAVPALKRALDLDRASGNQAGEALTLTVLAHAERRAGDAGSAREHVLAALDLFETLRTRISSPDLRAAAAGKLHQAYELAIDLLMDAQHAAPAAGHDRAALAVCERQRARSLLELLAEAGTDLDAGVEPALVERRKSLETRLGAKAERLHGGSPPAAAERQALESELADLHRQLDFVEAEIRLASPSYAELTWPRPADVHEIQELLGDDTVLLSYALGEARSFLWAVTAGDVRSFELPGRHEIEDAVRQAYGSLSTYDPSARRAGAEAAAALSRLLLGPVAEQLGSRRLAVVADGALSYLPFAALPLPGTGPVLVLERHEVVQLPSASVLTALRRTLAGRPPAPEAIAVLADPVFGPHDPRVLGAASGTAPAPVFERLPATRQEAELIAALAPPDGSFTALGFAADRERVLGTGLGSYRVVHFATHAVIDAQTPALSGLVLSRVDEQGRPRNGFLGLHDLYNLKLGADLVVLSGCRTALGREIRGEGLIGLTRAFFYAGAPRVVASLWRVEDRATAALMSRFYRALWHEGLRPAAALRAAQQELRQERRWRDPSFWAGFVLVGEWK